MNSDAIHQYAKRNIIANPNCSTAQMVVALKPLHDRAGIKRVVVSTYQSVSGAGKGGMDELWEQTKAIYNPVKDVSPEAFTKQIAFNVIPHIDSFWKMVQPAKSGRWLQRPKKLSIQNQSIGDMCTRSCICWP